jgi:predicted double-glycine peptidase
MTIELPLYRQQKDNTCALACLRMVLAAFESGIAERTLEAEAQMEEAGTPIEELERLARQHGLEAEILETTEADLREILAQGRLPIAYLDRAIFELNPRQRAKHSLRQAKIHAVVPSRVTEASVTFHDPLPPRVARRSVRLFRQAHVILGSYCVVCSKRAQG